MITPETIDRLKAQLLTSGISQQNQALYQVINLLIDAVRQSLTNFAVISGGGGGGGILSQSFITANNDQGTLPNSRQITAGFGISFNETGTRLIINASIPLIDGHLEGEIGPIGPPGPQGIQGLAGLMGPPGMDAECCESEIGFPIGNIWPQGLMDVPFAAGNFTGINSMTWTVDSADQVGFAYGYLRDINSMFVTFQIDGTDVGGTADVVLQIAIPDGRTCARLAIGSVFVNDAGSGSQLGVVQAPAGSTLIQIGKNPVTNWTLTSGDNTSVRGSIIIPL